jgi:hypothetical protein
LAPADFSPADFQRYIITIFIIPAYANNTEASPIASIFFIIAINDIIKVTNAAENNVLP